MQHQPSLSTRLTLTSSKAPPKEVQEAILSDESSERRSLPHETYIDELDAYQTSEADRGEYGFQQYICSFKLSAQSIFGCSGACTARGSTRSPPATPLSQALSACADLVPMPLHLLKPQGALSTYTALFCLVWQRSTAMLTFHPAPSQSSSCEQACLASASPQTGSCL